MYQENYYPPPEKYIYVPDMSNRTNQIVAIFLSLLFFIIMILIFTMFFACSSVSSGTSSTAPVVYNTGTQYSMAKSALNSIDGISESNSIEPLAAPLSAKGSIYKSDSVQPLAKPTKKSSSIINKTDGYISVSAPNYGEGVESTFKSSSLSDCASACDVNLECKGVWYYENDCYLLNKVPEIKDQDFKSHNLYLRKEYPPIIIDKVFLGTSTAKLINSEWWNIATHNSTGKINSFKAGITKSWYLSESHYDVINSGDLIGIYSTRSLTEKEIRHILDRDIHPSGVTCLVDLPTQENYQLDLSVFGRQVVYIKYINPK